MAIETVATAASDALIVATEEGLTEVSWLRAAGNQNPWARLRLRFSARSLASISARRLYRGGDSGPVRGFVGTQSGDLLPLAMKSGIEVGKPIALQPGVVDLLSVRLGLGWTAVWRYRSSILYLLGPDGTLGPPIDIAPAIHSLRPASIRTVWHDDRSRRLFIGTDYGLTVASTAPDSPLPLKSPAHIPALGLAEIGLVTRIAGRLVIAFTNGAARLAPDSKDTPIAIENVARRPIADFARDVRFTPTMSLERPENISAVAQVARDVIWVRTPDGVWEWTPESWQLLENADDTQPDALRLLPDGALVGVDLLGSKITLCVPPANLTSVQALREGFGTVNLVPDPDGDGVWALEGAEAVTGAGDGTRGYIRYLTPHGELSTTDGTVGGERRFQVARLSWQHPDGKTDWPESEHGGLLLPSGIRWLHVRDGVWRVHDWTSSTRARGLVPGGQSSTTAWLGISGDAGGGPVVRLDVTDRDDALAITKTHVACENGDAERIAADDSGYRWLVCRQAPGSWALHRIHPIDSDADQRLTITGLAEAPSYLFQQPLRRFALTDHGVAEVDRSGKASLVRLLADDEQGRFVTMAPSLPRQTIPIPSVWTVFARFGVPPAGSGRAFRLDIAASGATLNPLEPPAGGASSVAGWIPAGPGPGAVVWAPDTGAPRVEWYDVRAGEPLNRLELLGIDDARDAVQFRRADFKDSSAEDGLGDLAISAGQRVAMIDVRRRRAAPLAVPTSIHIERRDGTRDVYDLRTQVPPASVSHDSARIAIVFAQDYDNWWRSPQAQVRASAYQPWTDLDAAGLAALPLEAGSAYTLEYRSPDRDRLGNVGVQAVQLRTAPSPTTAPVWVLGLSLLTGTTLILAGSVRARRAALVWLGRRWLLITGDAQAIAYVIARGDSIRISLVLSGDPRERSVEARGDPRKAEEIRSLLNPGDDVRVIVDDDLFGQPWSKRIGTAWSWGGSAIVAGQIVSLPPVPVRRPEPAERFTFTSLACSRPGRGLAQLERADGERQLVSAQVSKWGAAVIVERENATADDFVRSLGRCDAVHVAAHASLAAIEFADCAFTIADLGADVRASMRTRLLILSACQTLPVTEQDSSLVMALVRAGVNVIAASTDVDDKVCAAFCVAFFQAFLPAKAAEGIPVASAIRAAAAACQKRFSKYGPESWKPTVDSFILYGDPSLQLVFRNPAKRAPVAPAGGIGISLPPRSHSG